MARLTKKVSELRPRLLLQSGEVRPVPKALDHVRPRLQDANRIGATIKKGHDRPKLRS